MYDLNKNIFLEESDYLRPELVLRSSSYPKSKVASCLLVGFVRKCSSSARRQQKQSTAAYQIRLRQRVDVFFNDVGHYCCIPEHVIMSPKCGIISGQASYVVSKQ